MVVVGGVKVFYGAKSRPFEALTRADGRETQRLPVRSLTRTDIGGDGGPVEQQHLRQPSERRASLTANVCFLEKKKKKRRCPCLNAGTTDGTFPGRVKPLSHVRPWKTRCGEGGGGGDWIDILYIPFKPDPSDFFSRFAVGSCISSAFLCACLQLARQIFMITLQLNRKLMLKNRPKNILDWSLARWLCKVLTFSKICLF